MKKCKQCGAPLVEDAKFCTKCGTLNETEMSAFAQNEPTKQRFNLKRNLIIIGTLVLGIGLLAGGYYFFSSSDKVSFNNGIVSQQAKNKRKKTVQTQFFSYKNGDYFGILDKNLTIINESLSTTPVVFNKFGAGVVNRKEKSVLVNTKGEEIADDDFLGLNMFNINYVSSYDNTVMQSKNGVMDFNIKSESEDDENYKILSGLIDSKGNIVLEAGEYQFMPFYGRTLTTFYRNNLAGVVNEKGEIIVEPINEQALVMSDKRIAVKKNESSKFNVVDLQGNIVEELPYDSIYFMYNFADYFHVTNVLGKSGIIDSNLKEILPPTFSSSISISENNKYILFHENERYGLNKINGETLIEPTYDYLSLPNEEGIVSFQKESTYGLMTVDEEVIDSSFEDSLYSIGGTNLFFQSIYSENEQSTSVVNGKGEVLATEELYFSGRAISPDNIYVLPRANEDSESTYEERTHILFNKNGQILSERATFFADLGENIFIQEDNYGVIMNKETGKIIKEKEL